MIRRSLGVALWSLVGFLACLLGALNALVGTRAGRTLLAQVASAAAEGVVSGSIDVGEVRGSLLTGVVLTDVRLLDPDSTLVAWLPRAELGYNPIDFAAGRVVFMEVRLERPIINIVQHANGKTNFDELLRLGEKDTVTVKPLGPAGPRSLILLRNVQIMDGSLTLRLQKHGQVTSANEEIEFSGEDGRYRVRRFEHLNARLAAFRIQAPREKGIRIDVLRLATESSDPEVSIADVVGSITIVGLTLSLDHSPARFPSTQFSARATVQWPRDTLLWNLAMRADSATLTDIRFLDPRFPSDAVLHGGVTLASHGGRVLEIQLRPLDLAFGQGRLTGRVTAFSAADSGLVALRQGDLGARYLSLDFARIYIGSLPFYGRLNCPTIVDGPMSALKIETDWSFRDSLVPGWPESQIRGKGEVNIGGKDLAFQPFAVDAGRIDIGTVRRLVPGFDLQGELYATGTLTGTLKKTMFSGTLRHHDGERPASTIRGVIGLDTRTDVLGVFADLRVPVARHAGRNDPHERRPHRRRDACRSRDAGRGRSDARRRDAAAWRARHASRFRRPRLHAARAGCQPPTLADPRQRTAVAADLHGHRQRRGRQRHQADGRALGPAGPVAVRRYHHRQRRNQGPVRRGQADRRLVTAAAARAADERQRLPRMATSRPRHAVARVRRRQPQRARFPD